ncbi:MAG: hypothetical protein P4L75_07995 [Clostridia bacterium]|nr:hypothetical protein [Clostridia bacterium]MDR3644801.1 hypothetical protein [Clostridia bacterium]
MDKMDKNRNLKDNKNVKEAKDKKTDMQETENRRMEDDCKNKNARNSK